MSRKSGYWIAAWVIVVVVLGMFVFGSGRGGSGYEDYTGYSGYGGPSPGRGHMNRWGDSWRGLGPGMMGPDTWGWGMGGASYGMRYGMGPGLMGYGREMAYGPAYGPAFGPSVGPGYGMPDRLGAMSLWALPDLTPEQQRQIEQLSEAAQERQRALMRLVSSAQATLLRLQAAERRDWPAIRAAALAQHDAQRQQLEARLEFQQKVDALLSDSQRKLHRIW